MRRIIRNGVAVVHLWLGLILGLYFAVVGLSGSILVFEPELKAQSLPETLHVAPPSPGAAALPAAEVLARLRQQRPAIPDAQAARLDLPVRSGGAYTVFYGDPQKPMDRRALTIDPYTGRVITDKAIRDSIPGFALMLHAYLLLGMRGFLANGVCGLLAALLLLSGLWLWWPRTLRQLALRATVKWRGGARRVNADLHDVFGAYSLPLLLILSLTGSALVFYAPVQKAVFAWTKTPPRPPAPKVTPPAGDARRLPVETLLRIARQAVPDAHPTAIEYPTRPDQPFSCDMELTLTGFANYAEVAIDPYTGRVLRADDERRATPGARAMRVLCGLHFGWWGGPVTKALYCLAGSVPFALFVTGVLIYARKTCPRRSRATPFRQAGKGF